MDKFQYTIRFKKIATLTTKKSKKEMIRALQQEIVGATWIGAAHLKDSVQFEELSFYHKLFKKLKNAHTGFDSLPSYIKETVTNITYTLLELAVAENIPQEKLLKAFEFDNIEGQVDYKEVALCLEGVYCSYSDVSLASRIAVINATRSLATGRG